MEPVEVFDFAALTSLGAIAALAVGIVAAINRLVKDVKILNQIPIVVYAVTVATGLTILSHWLGHLQTVLETPQNWFEAVASVSITTAVMAVGLHSGGKNLKATPAKRAALLLLLAIPIVGCSSDVAFFHAADAYHKSTEPWLDSVERDETLTQQEKDLRRENFETHGELIEQKRIEIQSEVF